MSPGMGTRTGQAAMLLPGLELVRRAEGAAAAQGVALVEGLRGVDPSSPALSRPVAGGHLVLLGPGMYVNRGIALALGQAISDADLDRIESLSAHVGVSPELEVSPWADESLLGRAGARGYAAAWMRTVLVCSLPAPAPAAAASGTGGEAHLEI
jgi:hypothetical protein